MSPQPTGRLQLGLAAGIVDAMPSTGIAAEPQRRERAPAPGRAPAARLAADSPFAKLAARGAELPPAQRLSANALDPGTPIDLPPDALAVLATLLGDASGAPAVERTLLGTMLLAAEDAPAPGLETIARRIAGANVQAAVEDFGRWLETSERALALTRGNVAAMVQRVLREAYLIGTEVLRDYADKVRFYNDSKKKLRDLLAKARETRAAWTAEAQALGEGESFVADPPFELVEVDADTGEPFTPAMTADDVERWKAQQASAARGASGSSLAELGVVFGPSRLGGAELAELDEMTRDKDHGIGSFFDSNDDDYIRDNIDTLTALIPRMNHREIEKYLFPIVDTLIGGNTDEEEILAIFGALTPVQLLFMMSGVAPSDFDGSSADVTVEVVWPFPGFLDEGECAEMRLLGVKAAIAVAAELGIEFSGELTGEAAVRLLGALTARQRQVEADGGGAVPTVGSPRTAATTDELESYIERLEEQLNGIGDDAQLANVDLQNQLQRQQQLLQMMSNMAKVLHDTAMAIVRKVGA